MIIRIQDLGNLSDEEHSKVKFILLDNGDLLFGKCKWHKDLQDASSYKTESVQVVGAGTVPLDVDGFMDDEKWGGWKSTGYSVITPDNIRKQIVEAFKVYKGETPGL